MQNHRVPAWDIFCRVIDNYGDIGVCWRLCQQLAAQDQSVRLILDDASALDWMTSPASTSASSAQTELVEVLTWDDAKNIGQPADVVIESFGCELPESYMAKISLKANTGVASHWINLEYLSAEPYVERNHKLLSPVMSGAGKGLFKTFFYPGFTNQTGGLMRELDLPIRQAQFDKAAWLQAHSIHWKPHERIVSLFCYEPAALEQLIAELQNSDQPTLLLVTAGRACEAVKAVLEKTVRTEPIEAPLPSKLRIAFLPYLTQADYDHLLWASDFNFVRGEDSLVRAIWAGKPFVWQIYPQDDGAHHAKLAAFLDVYLLSADAAIAAQIRTAHDIWNGISKSKPTSHILLDLQEWQAASQAQSGVWAGLPSLVERLLEQVQTSNHPAAPYSQSASGSLGM